MNLSSVESIQLLLVTLGLVLLAVAPAIYLYNAFNKTRPLVTKPVVQPVASSPSPVIAYRPVPAVQPVYKPYLKVQETEKGVRPGELKKTAKMHFGRLLRSSQKLMTAIPREELVTEPPSPDAPLGPETWMKRVFILDDDPSVLHTLALLVANFGYEPVTSTSPVDALARLLAEPFDVLITDYQMLLINGLELTQKLRNQHCVIPVLLISGDVPGIDLFLSEQLSVMEILPKPIDVAKLQEILNTILSAESPDSFRLFEIVPEVPNADPQAKT
jgi:CheY-like chemotaxis protein